jgi:hypothetical protein
MPSTLKSASVYLRRGFYYVHPLAGSGGGDPALFMEPVVKLQESVDAAALGECVLEALKRSHHNAPWPKIWKDFTAPLLREAGVKSETAFTRGAKYVRVNLDGGAVTLVTSTSKKYKNAAAPLGEIKFALGDARELGLKLVEGLAASD